MSVAKVVNCRTGKVENIPLPPDEVKRKADKDTAKDARKAQDIIDAAQLVADKQARRDRIRGGGLPELKAELEALMDRLGE